MTSDSVRRNFERQLYATRTDTFPFSKKGSTFTVCFDNWASGRLPETPTGGALVTAAPLFRNELGMPEPLSNPGRKSKVWVYETSKPFTLPVPEKLAGPRMAAVTVTPLLVMSRA